MKPTAKDGARKPVKFVESCGCVFCDLGLDPDDGINGRPVHMHRERGIGYSFCTHNELPPHEGAE
jgi:hypothetical protein